ncbi:MAG: MraZ N-terminal domain containing protein [Lachnospiraceae bacterium]|nr:MraZ N-terminal domain containing protein [Lachnospiraceae bacterium]
MANYDGDILKVTRRLDGKGRLSLPTDFREALGFAPDEEVEVSAIRLVERNQLAFIITRKEGKE